MQCWRTHLSRVASRIRLPLEYRFKIKIKNKSKSFKAFLKRTFQKQEKLSFLVL